jgi:hypothetical protein
LGGARRSQRRGRSKSSRRIKMAADVATSRHYAWPCLTSAGLRPGLSCPASAFLHWPPEPWLAFAGQSRSSFPSSGHDRLVNTFGLCQLSCPCMACARGARHFQNPTAFDVIAVRLASRSNFISAHLLRSKPLVSRRFFVLVTRERSHARLSRTSEIIAAWPVDNGDIGDKKSLLREPLFLA